MGRFWADSPAACKKNIQKKTFIFNENVLFLPPCFKGPGIWHNRLFVKFLKHLNFIV